MTKLKAETSEVSPVSVSPPSLCHNMAGETSEVSTRNKMNGNQSAPPVNLALKMEPSLVWIEVPSEEARYLYVLECTETKRLKIGITDDYQSRIKKIQSMSATQLELKALLLSVGYELELFLHRKYQHLRLHGEWFESDPELLEEIENLSKQDAETQKRWEQTKAKP